MNLMDFYMDVHIYYIFILKNFFQDLYGLHYPTEIIQLIVLIFYRPVKIATTNHTILVSDKTYVWGLNTYGQLGLGDCQNRHSPQKLPLHNIKLVGCGSEHTIAVIMLNEIYAWGRNDKGQLGLGDCTNRSTPQKLIFPKISIELVCCGSEHTVILTSSGKVYGWGRNESGQLGLGDDNCYKNTPHELNLLYLIKSICCGIQHTIALTYSNEIYVWGNNNHGQLGLGDTLFRNSPQKLSLQGEFGNLNIKSISCNGNFTIVLTSNGTIYSWGYNYFGQLGFNTRVSLCLNNPQPHLVNFSNIVIESVSCGYDHTIIIEKSGCSYTWGKNIHGQLGIGRNAPRHSPKELMLKNIDTIVCGSDHTIAITNTYDKIYVWGNNYNGQLGLGDNNSRDSPCLLKFEH